MGMGMRGGMGMGGMRGMQGMQGQQGMQQQMMPPPPEEDERRRRVAGRGDAVGTTRRGPFFSSPLFFYFPTHTRRADIAAQVNALLAAGASLEISSGLDGDGDNSSTQSEMRDAFVKYSALRQASGEGPNFK